MSDCVDFGQTLHSATSDLGHNCLLRPVCLNIQGFIAVKMYIYREDISVICRRLQSNAVKMSSTKLCCTFEL